MCPPPSISANTSQTHTNFINTAVIVPRTQISQSAYAHASSILAPSIFNHSIRVYLYAAALAKHTTSIYSTATTKHDLLFVACLFHDIGTTSIYNGPSRFEIEGADAAVQHLSKHHVSDADKHKVWVAIALHTSPQLAERIGELARLVRIAVLTDFGRTTAETEVLEPLREKLEEEFERCRIEKVLGDAVVCQAKEKPEKAPMVTWAGVMYRAHLEELEWEGVNKAF